jgi:hypothetical protein
MSPASKKAYVCVGVFLAMVFAAIGGFLLSPNDAPLFVGLVVFSVWGAGLIGRAVAGPPVWRVCWIIGCVIGVAAATTSMGDSVLILAVGIVITLATTATGIWTIVRWIDPHPGSAILHP